jgi:hypothetical protein
MKEMTTFEILFAYDTLLILGVVLGMTLGMYLGLMTRKFWPALVGVGLSVIMVYFGKDFLSEIEWKEYVVKYENVSDWASLKFSEPVTVVVTTKYKEHCAARIPEVTVIPKECK